MKKIFFACISIFITQLTCFSQAPSVFNHPGIMSGQAELVALKLAVETNDGSPKVEGYNKLAAESLGSLNYQPTPYADVYVIGSGSCKEERAFRQDAHALYIQAIKWVVTGNNAHRDKAIEIADAWAATFKRIIPEPNKPNQSTLEASWALPIWIAGAEILKTYNNGASGWSSAKFNLFVREVLSFVNGNIYQTANWLISKDLSLMAAGVFLNDKDLYNQGYNHVSGQIDAITVDGKIPELNRDFVHSQYVLIGLTQCAEVAWQQGNSDLFTRSGSRLMTGAETYVQSVMGTIEPKYFSGSEWARQSAPYEILLNRYTALGMTVPNVQNYVVNYNRTENGSEDHFVGWLSATHAIPVSGGTDISLQQKVINNIRQETIQRADSFLTVNPVTVTDAFCPRSAGGRHDFYSEGDYWWPDPLNADGPYIRNDGQSNPANFSDHRFAMIRLSDIVSTLTSAWLLTGSNEYAAKAVEHLNAWFVDSTTMMNPNMLYAQAIWGRYTGRGIGLIDAYHLVEVAQSVKKLSAKKGISTDESAKIKKWFADFLTWMTTHPYGIEEMNAKNNHGTCWFATASIMAVLTNNKEMIDFCRNRFKTDLLPNQMAADGSFPLELGRTKPYGYSLFNMDAMANLAQILSTPDDNLWKYKTKDSRSLQNGMEFIYPYIRDKTTWPYTKDIYIWDKWPVRQSSLLFAGLAFKNADYIDTFLALPMRPTNPEVIRNLPVRHPVIWLIN